MKVIYLDANSTMIPHIGVMIDEAVGSVSKGDEVVYITCGAYLDNCYGSPIKTSLNCSICKSGYKKNLSRFESPNFKHKTSNSYGAKKIEDVMESYDFNFQSIDELKSKKYKDIDVGYAALSSFISNTRNMNPDLNDFARSILTTMLKTAVRTSLLCEEIYELERPEKVVIFNGRMPETRPILRYFSSKNIDVEIMEVVPKDLDGNFKKLSYINSLPHSIEYFHKQIDLLWNVNPETSKVRGELFFKNRRNAEFSGDKIYTAKQVPDLLPKGWDKSAHNVVIFNSSEDEFASIGAEWENKLFPTQQKGIEFIFSLVDKHPNAHVYLRIHPNLKDIKYRYHTDLYKLSIHPRVHIISGSSEVSTYALVDNANVVVSFGTSVGVEAAYSNKPVVLLGPSFYRNLGFCYEPNNLNDVEDQVFSKNLTPLYSENIFKYGNYIMSSKGKDWEHFNFNCQKINFFGTKTPNAYMLDQNLNLLQKYGILASRTWRYIQRVLLNIFIKEQKTNL